tara:strand:+ start:9369 stop:9656 length:288 start_codon:yes stop_codon:yes gene_type:complete
MDYKVTLKLYGEIAQFDGSEYALIRKVSVVSEDPDFPDMLCVALHPVKLIALQHIGPGSNNCGECDMPSRSRTWETSTLDLKDFLESDDERNVLW